MIPMSIVPPIDLSLNGASAFSDLPTKLHACAVIYEELAHLKQVVREYENQIRAWSSRQNTLSSVSKIPPEMLLRIFDFLAHGENDDRSPIRDWIHVTHVCSEWRIIALNCPELWTRPLFYHPGCAMEMIRRAGIFPLNLELDLTNLKLADEPGLIEIFNSSLRRATSAKLHHTNYDPPAPHAFDIAGFSHPALLLRSLEISAQNPLSWVLTWPQGNLPQLRKLHLKNCHFFGSQWFHVPDCSRITDLEISFDSPSTASNRLFATKVAEILPMFKSLRRLHLRNAFQMPTFVTEMGYALDLQINSLVIPRPVSLPSSLVDISIVSDLLSCHAFFSRATYPTSARIAIKVNADGQPGEGHVLQESSINRLLRIISRTREHPIRGLTLRSGEHNLTHVEIWTAAGAQPLNYTRTVPQISICAPISREILHSLPWILPLKKLHTLNYFLPINRDDLWRKFGRLPKLTLLNTGSLPWHIAKDLLKVVAFQTRDQIEAHRPEIGSPFRSLRCLELRDWKVLGTLRTSEPGFRLGVPLDDLKNLGEVRRERGRPLCLHLIGCTGLSYDDILELAEAFGNRLVWSGLEESV